MVQVSAHVKDAKIVNLVTEIKTRMIKTILT